MVYSVRETQDHDLLSATVSGRSRVVGCRASRAPDGDEREAEVGGCRARRRGIGPGRGEERCDPLEPYEGRLDPDPGSCDTQSQAKMKWEE